MELLFYNIFLLFFRSGAHIAALFSKKAALFVAGRRGLFKRLQAAIGDQDKIIWMHCASLGEFEQGRPVLEKLRRQYPEYKLLVTFFSPSGYEVMKNYKGADWIFYLPIDGPVTAKRFLDTVSPELVIFVKYEYWYHYLSQVRQRGIPLLMISAIFRKNSAFFKWYGGIYRKMLGCITHFFVQNPASAQLLSELLSPGRYTVTGDTRFDRVADIAEKGDPLPLIEAFTANAKTIIAGSSWPPDEVILQKALSATKGQFKLIIAPHEIGKDHISQLQSLFPGCLLYSQLLSGEKRVEESDVLIINNIGLLSRMYRYAHNCYIGGAFGDGLHNTLEAAVYGKPVVFGTRYEKFAEASGLIEAGAGFSITNESAYINLLNKLDKEESYYRECCKAARDFVYQHKGATGRIIQYIQENRLLTN